jgi:hypothetical protein
MPSLASLLQRVQVVIAVNGSAPVVVLYSVPQN